jgi:hypothetical protein
MRGFAMKTVNTDLNSVRQWMVLPEFFGTWQRIQNRKKTPNNRYLDLNTFAFNMNLQLITVWPHGYEHFSDVMFFCSY